MSFSKTLAIIGSFILPIDRYWSSQDEAVIISLRLPRALLAILIGSGLAASGTVFQGIFRNPLVSPHILGVAAAAGFGGVAAMLFWPGSPLVFLSAFLFGNLAVLASYSISRVRKTTPILMLVLAGVIVNTFFTALISLIKYVADPIDKLPSIVYWLMGSLATASYHKLSLVFLPMLVCIGILNLLRWRINILSLGEEEAKSLGVEVEKTKWLIISCVSIIVSLAVSVSGIIGWIGLVIPHIARMLIGADHKQLLPVSTLLGAIYLLIIDDLSRSVTAAEIPLGILTSIVGAIIFALLLKKTVGGEWYGR